MNWSLKRDFKQEDAFFQRFQNKDLAELALYKQKLTANSQLTYTSSFFIRTLRLGSLGWDWTKF